MKAIVQDRYGSADVLSLRDIDKPSVGDHDVLIRVVAASLSPGVWHLMTGLPYLIRLMGFGLRKPKLPVRGEDVAGRVEQVGRNVTRFKKGDEVFGTCDGAFAEFACASEDRFVLKPTKLSFEQAAAIPDSAVTGLEGLRDVAKVRAGQSVLIIGAGGGIGTFSVQLAKAFGAEVTGLCSTAKTELVLSLGADHVIDYTREEFPAGNRRYDVIFDTAGNRPLSQLRRALTTRGTLVIVGGEGAGQWFGLGRQLRAFLISPFVGQKLCSFISMHRSKDDLQQLKDLIESDQLKPVIDRIYPLSETADAIRYWAQGHAQGKIIIAV